MIQRSRNEPSLTVRGYRVTWRWTGEGMATIGSAGFVKTLLNGCVFAAVCWVLALTALRMAAAEPSTGPAAAAVPPPGAAAQRGAAELERLVQPLALHPDPLMAIVLSAAVYPLEIVQAARFVERHQQYSATGPAAVGRECQGGGAVCLAWGPSR
jgi:hypothetical protein